MAVLSGRRISAGVGVAFCAACRIVAGAAVAGAGISLRPRTFICVGFPVGGDTFERAVSRAREPERGGLIPAASAHGGQCGSGRIHPRTSNVYEQPSPVDPAALLRAARAALHRLPREAGGDPPPASPAARKIKTARKRGSSL